MEDFKSLTGRKFGITYKDIKDYWHNGRRVATLNDKSYAPSKLNYVEGVIENFCPTAEVVISSKDYGFTIISYYTIVQMEEIIEDDSDKDLRQSEVDNAYKTLMNIGVQMCEPDSSYRPFNEVMIDLGRVIKNLRESTEEKQFETTRDYVYRSLVGLRYFNQFKF